MTVTAYRPVSFSSLGISVAIPLPWPYEASRDLVITVNGEIYQGSVTFPSSQQMLLSPYPAAGTRVVIARATNVDAAARVFAGGPIGSSDLNANMNEVLHALQENEEATTRAIVAPIGEAALVLPSAAVRASKVLAFGPDGSVSPVALVDFGASPSQSLHQISEPETFLVGATTDDQAFAASITATRETRATASYSFRSKVSVPGGAVIGGFATVAAHSGYTDPIFFSILAGTAFKNVLMDGSGLPAPTLDWGTGGYTVPVGTGIVQLDPVAGVFSKGPTLENVTISNTPGGAIFLRYVDSWKVDGLSLNNIQTNLSQVLNAGLEVYHGSNINLSNVQIRGFRTKAVDLGYCTNVYIASLGTFGGSPGQSALHTVGGDRLTIVSHVHDGLTTKGYGSKFWATDDVAVLQADYRNCDGGMQFYGSKGHVTRLIVSEVTAEGFGADAYQAAAQTGAEVDVVVDDYECFRTPVVNDSAKVGILLRSDDAANACPFTRAEFKRAKIRGGWGGVYGPSNGGTVNYLAFGELDVGNIHANGYPFYACAKTIYIKRLILRAGLSNGLVAFTNATSRGGKFIIDEVVLEDGLLTTEPVIRLGLPSSLEASFAEVEINGISGLGGGHANTKLVDLNLDMFDQAKRVTIRNVNVAGLVAATQITIQFKAAATLKPILTLTDLSATDATATQLALAVTNGSVCGQAYQTSNHLTTTGL